MKKILLKIVALAGLLSALNVEAQIQYSNEFWISTNATGNIYPSGGTLANPLDGSTPSNFNANMSSLPPYSTIHILAGTYEVSGSGANSSEWSVLSGQKIIGSGIDNTILQLVPGTPQGAVIASSQWSGGIVTNVEVADLTCDCNWQGSDAYSGVNLNGTGIIVRRVKVIHCGTTSNEVWGISVGNGAPNGVPSSQGNIIESCEVSEYAGGPKVTAIGVGGSPGYDWHGIVRDNVVLFPVDSSVAAQGINGSFVSGAVVDGNYVYGALSGIYSDTGGWTNTVIINNTLQNCFNGVTIAPANNPLKNLTIAFNKIDLVATNNYNAIAFNFWGGIWTNIFIFGNTVDFYNSGSSPGWLIAAHDITGLVVENNFIDPVIASNQLSSTAQTYWTNVNNVTIDNNYDLYGNYLYDLNMPTLGGVPVSPLGLSLVNSAEVSSALTNLGLPSNPAAVVTNNATGLTLSGTFTGSGSGLTGLNWSDITGVPTFAQYSDPAPTFTNGMNIGANIAYQIGGNNVLWASNSPGIGDNFVVGREPAGVVPNGLGNLIVGSYAMPGSTNANGNTMVGISAGRNLLSTSYNTLIGDNAGYALQYGNDNTLLGYQSGYGPGALTNGNQNTLIGDSTLYRARSGTNNVALGYFAGSWLSSGNNNVFIAHQGTSAETNSNGTIYIGDPGVHNTTYIAGTVYSGNGFVGNSLTATNGFQCATNYVPSTWVPVPGSVILRASNNWMFAITAHGTNAVFKFGP